MDNVFPSPAELLFGRAISTFLPNHSTDKPAEQYRSHFEKRAGLQKHYADVHTSPPPRLRPGQNVRIRDHQTQQWLPGQVVEEQRKRFYVVKTNRGNQITRNRAQLRADKSNDISRNEQEPVLPTGFAQPQNETATAPESSGTVKTRCGRVVKAPIRYRDQNIDQTQTSDQIMIVV